MNTNSKRAAEVRFARAELAKKPLNYIDVKTLSEILEGYRAKVRICINDCHAARASIQSEPYGYARLYLVLESAIADKNLNAALTLWRMANNHYHEAFKTYLQQCLGDSTGGYVRPAPQQLEKAA